MCVCDSPAHGKGVCRWRSTERLVPIPEKKFFPVLLPVLKPLAVCGGGGGEEKRRGREQQRERKRCGTHSCPARGANEALWLDVAGWEIRIRAIVGYDRR